MRKKVETARMKVGMVYANDTLPPRAERQLSQVLDLLGEVLAEIDATATGTRPAGGRAARLT